MRKLITLVTILAFSFATIGCTKGLKVTNAQEKLVKTMYYVNLARTLLPIAVSQFSDNEKVTDAAEVVQASLETIEETLALINAGLSKDYDKLGSQTTVLIKAVLSLLSEINAARGKKTSN
jgi:hypothetical protein